MESGVGASLREARKRRDLDLTEVEAAIKIRVRYLRAIEDEDWDVLPGDVYARGFIRTYASYLGLDGERLAEEQRRETGAREERGSKRVEPVGSAIPPGRRRFRGRALTAVVVLAVAALLVAVGLIGDEGDDGGSAARDTAAERAGAPSPTQKTSVSARPGVALGVTATDEVWVCLLDSDEQALVDGEILLPGEEAGPFRSQTFAAAFGNGAVELTIDGRAARTATSSSPIGYEIDRQGKLTPLPEGERPDCA